MNFKLLLAFLGVGAVGCGATSPPVRDQDLEDKVSTGENTFPELVKTVSRYIDSDGRTGTKEEYCTEEGRLVRLEIIAGSDFDKYHDIVTYDRFGRIKTQLHIWIEDYMTRRNPSAEKARWLDTFTYFDNGYVQKTTLDNTDVEQNSQDYISVNIQLRDSKKRLVKELSGKLTPTGVIIQSNVFTFEYDRERRRRRIVNTEHIKNGRLVSTDNDLSSDGNKVYDNDPIMVYTINIQLQPGRRLYQLRSDVK